MARAALGKGVRRALGVPVYDLVKTVVIPKGLKDRIEGILSTWGTEEPRLPALFPSRSYRPTCA
jgi:hypothetical protein